MKLSRVVLMVTILYLLMVLPCFASPMVKPCYLIPADQKRDIYHEELQEIRESLVQVQAFFASEMDRLGYGQKTFEFSTEIPLWVSTQKLSFYKAIKDVRNMGIPRDNKEDILLVFLVGAESINSGAPGVYTGRCETNTCTDGIAVIPLKGRAEYRNRIIAHELAHSFGYLNHLTTLENYIMETLVIHPNPTFEQYSLDNYKIHPETASRINQSEALSLRNITDTELIGIDADVNNDGQVDLDDVKIVRKAIQAQSNYKTDVNNSGKTDEEDVLLVKAKAMEELAAAAPLLPGRIKIVKWCDLKKN